MIRALRRQRFETGCTIDIEHSERSLHAHLDLDHGGDLRPGDRVQVRGEPIRVVWGERLTLRRTAVVERAGWLERQWTRLAGRLAFADLYDVSFTSRRVL
jgi:hypothetical protein